MVIAFLISWLLIDQYLLCPHYIFSLPKPFTGENIINPYKDANFSDVSIANFHAHTKSWGGLTNGKGNSSDVSKRYNMLGYSFYAVSQYHSIDKFNEEKKNYISVYEHGYNLKKTHQLVIGAKQVFWKDYIFPQTINNKQYVLQELASDTNNLVVLNHPALRSGYDVEDLKMLHYYDYIEVLNPNAQSFAHWDTALSAGKKVFIVGNDDNHNIFNNNAIGRFTTLIFGVESDGKKLISKMKKGQNVAVWLPQIHDENIASKRKKIDSLRTFISNISMIDTLLHVELKKKVAGIRVIGRNGKMRFDQNNVSSIKFPFPKDESYLRVEFSLEDGTVFYFNPIYRSNSTDELERNAMASNFISRKNTNPIMESFALASFIGLFVCLRHVKKRSKFTVTDLNMDKSKISLG